MAEEFGQTAKFVTGRAEGSRADVVASVEGEEEEEGSEADGEDQEVGRGGDQRGSGAGSSEGGAEEAVQGDSWEVVLREVEAAEDEASDGRRMRSGRVVRR